MGNCCSLNTQCEARCRPLEQRERWYIGNSNFDLLAYKQKLLVCDHVSFQRLLLSSWPGLDLSVSTTFKYPAQVDSQFLKELTDARLKGVPNDLIRDTLLRLIPFDDDCAREEYVCLFDNVEAVPDFFRLSRTEEPLFGRRSLTNLFLTKVGIGTSKRVLYMLQRSDFPRAVCLALPRIVQLMLWHLKEHEVYMIIRALLRDHRLPTSLEDHTMLVDAGLASCGLAPTHLTRHLFEDILFNLCTRYIPVAFYSQVLVTVVIEGMAGLLPYAVALFDQHKAFIAQLCTAATDPMCAIKELRRECLTRTVMTSLLSVVYAMTPHSLTSSASTELVSFLPVFNGCSSILCTDAVYISFAEVLPDQFTSIDLVPLSEANPCQSLRTELNEVSENRVILIETRHHGILALLLGPNEHYFIHIIEEADIRKGGTVEWTSDCQHGFRVFQDKQVTLHLNAELSEATLHVNPGFPELPEGQISVHQIELLRLFK